MTHREIAFLQTVNEYPSVSILMPTQRTVPDKLQDPIRLKDLIRKAIEGLKAEFPERDLTSLYGHLNKAYDSIDFTATLGGIALFANKYFGTIYVLPFPIKEQVIIDKNFATSNLVFALNRMPRYFVLALSRNLSRLFQGFGAAALHEIIEPEVDKQGNPISGFPLNDLGPEEHKWLAIGTGDRDARYLEDHAKQFFRFVDSFLSKFLEHDELPIIILGAGKDIELFETVTKNKRLIIAHHHGNFDRQSAEAISRIVEPIVQDYLKKQREKALEELVSAQGTLKYAEGFEPVWYAAHIGRIHKLFIETDLEVIGSYNAAKPEQVIITNKIETHGNVYNLIEPLIDAVRAHRGEIIFVEPGALADRQHIAAILRYELDRTVA